MEESDVNGTRFWATQVPTKVKFFSWLFCNDHLPTRANLLHKHMLEEKEVVCPRGCAVVESAEHIFLDRPTTASI